MKTYIFYSKGESVKIILKSKLSEDEKIKFKKDGFKKHPVEVEAFNESDAAKKLQEHTDGNLKDLKSFSGSYLFSAIVIIILLIATYSNL